MFSNQKRTLTIQRSDNFVNLNTKKTFERQTKMSSLWTNIFSGNFYCDLFLLRRTTELLQHRSYSIIIIFLDKHKNKFSRTNMNKTIALIFLRKKTTTTTTTTTHVLSCESLTTPSASASTWVKIAFMCSAISLF